MEPVNIVCLVAVGILFVLLMLVIFGVIPIFQSYQNVKVGKEIYVTKEAFDKFGETCATKAGIEDTYATKAGMKDTYATKAGIEETYATKAGIEETYATKAGIEETYTPKTGIEETYATKADIEDQFATILKSDDVYNQLFGNTASTTWGGLVNYVSGAIGRKNYISYNDETDRIVEKLSPQDILSTEAWASLRRTDILFEKGIVFIPCKFSLMETSLGVALGVDCDLRIIENYGGPYILCERLYLNNGRRWKIKIEFRRIEHNPQKLQIHVYAHAEFIESKDGVFEKEYTVHRNFETLRAADIELFISKPSEQAWKSATVDCTDASGVTLQPVG